MDADANLQRRLSESPSLLIETRQRFELL